MKCGQQLPHELSSAIFPSAESANHAQYVDAPHTRPVDYSVFPFRLTPRSERRLEPHSYAPQCDHCVETAALRAQLDSSDEKYSPQVHGSFMRALRTSNAHIMAGGQLAAANHIWVEGQFTVHCLCNESEVVRHKHEGPWTNHTAASWEPKHTDRGSAAVQRYLFAVPCDNHAASMEGDGLGSGVPMCSSSVHHSLAFQLPAIFRLVHHWPPVYRTEHMAYGFVHRWVLVRQGPVHAVIARVGILSSEKSESTSNRTWIRRFPAADAVANQGRTSVVPQEARRNLFMAGQHILQRITVAPLPFHRDNGTWVAAPIR